jgi:fatty-acyl-CoA synthase
LSPAIRAFGAGSIAYFKILKYIWFIEDFPMTVAGKLQKFRMLELALERRKAGTTR